MSNDQFRSLLFYFISTQIPNDLVCLGGPLEKIPQTACSHCSMMPLSSISHFIHVFIVLHHIVSVYFDCIWLLLFYCIVLYLILFPSIVLYMNMLLIDWSETVLENQRHLFDFVWYSVNVVLLCLHFSRSQRIGNRGNCFWSFKLSGAFPWRCGQVPQRIGTNSRGARWGKGRITHVQSAIMETADSRMIARYLTAATYEQFSYDENNVPLIRYKQ